MYSNSQIMAAEQEKLGDLVKAHQQGRKVRTRGTFGVVKVSSLTEVCMCLNAYPLVLPVGLHEFQLATRWN